MNSTMMQYVNEGRITPITLIYTVSSGMVIGTSNHQPPYKASSVQELQDFLCSGYDPELAMSPALCPQGQRLGGGGKVFGC